MIERVSRYYDGPIAQTQDKYTTAYSISVFRKFPDKKTVNFLDYTWVEGDSLSAISEKYSKGAKYWWELMDINPEILDPFNITPGTIIRVPYGN